MTATFLVTLNLPDDSPDSLLGIAEDLTDSLSIDGFNVQSVAPWARQDMQPSTPTIPFPGQPVL